LFAAVWPPEDVLDHLDLALGAVRRTLPGDGAGPVRWSARETWHLTCAFYGDVPDGRAAELAGALGRVASGSAPYRLRLRGAGVFSHRTLWVGVGGDTAAQQALAHAAVAAGERVDARPDDRPRERAHLTIGRVRDLGGRGRRPGGDRGVGERPSGRGGGAGSGDEGPGRPWGRSRARGQEPPFDADLLVGALAVYEGPEWTVDSLLLVASRPGAGRGGGPLYTIVEDLPLAGLG
jgi:2'-5' RNA ligase